MTTFDQPNGCRIAVESELLALPNGHLLVLLRDSNPALDPAASNDDFLFVAIDDDCATTDGFHAGAPCADPSNMDTVFLADRVTSAPTAKALAATPPGGGPKVGR